MTGTPRRWARWPGAVVVVLGIQFVGWTECVLRPIVVAGPSMEPALRHGDHVLVDLWTYRQRAPRPAEVLVLQAPGPARTLFVKRAGRTGEPLPAPTPDVPPGGTLWVQGDNAGDSLDSRQLGELPADRITGRVVLRYWPLSRLGFVR